MHDHKADPIRVALTGGPGGGKTSLLGELAKRGHSIAPEVARAIIADRKARGLSARPTPGEFARAIIARDIAQYEAVSTVKGLVFFDRSLLDSLWMLGEVTELSRGEQRLLKQYPYHSTAFVLPPWRAIYRTDTERDQTYEQAVAVCHSLRAWYARCGYTAIDVPVGTVDERCEFVLQHCRRCLSL
jgi:predicted ATPase